MEERQWHADESQMTSELMNTYNRHCITCRHEADLDEDPCKTCLDTDPIGRERPLWGMVREERD